MGGVDAEDFLGDGGEEAAFVVQVEPGVLAVHVEFQEMEGTVGIAQEIKPGEGETGAAHHAADGIALLRCQLAGTPQGLVVEGVDAAVSAAAAGHFVGEEFAVHIDDGDIVCGAAETVLQEPGVGGIQPGGVDFVDHENLPVAHGFYSVGLADDFSRQLYRGAVQHLPGRHGEIFCRQAHLAHFVPGAVRGGMDKRAFAAVNG